jgi:hypothetical protein
MGDTAMSKRIILKALLTSLFVFSLIVIPACSQSTAEPSAFTGDTGAAPTHERHATGIESQAADM